MTGYYGLLMLLSVAVSPPFTRAFLMDSSPTKRSLVLRRNVDGPTFFSPSALSMAGFGAALKKKEIKMKPKKQWDRYSGDLKGCERVRVAVKVVDRSSSAEEEEAAATMEWMEVGTVRSKDDAFTEAAVIRQKALIADHSRRVFPVQIFTKDTLEWGYMAKGQDEWTSVAGKVVDMPADIDKMIGFLGLADPTGFYQKKVETIDNSALDGGFDSLMKKRTNG
jgi:hypothetical protein